MIQINPLMYFAFDTYIKLNSIIHYLMLLIFEQRLCQKIMFVISSSEHKVTQFRTGFAK